MFVCLLTFYTNPNGNMSQVQGDLKERAFTPSLVGGFLVWPWQQKEDSSLLSLSSSTLWGWSQSGVACLWFQTSAPSSSQYKPQRLVLRRAFLKKNEKNVSSMSICVSIWSVCIGVQVLLRPEANLRSPRAGVIGSCGWLDMAAGNRTQVLCTSCALKCSHFSNPGESTFDIGKSMVIFEASLEAELAI